ncbi:response regulator [Pontibacter sp. MBLB2868]|uniref:response regulator n=1 Tax=Pontibacter sp. MBLB2868 TaxID=3451555 RepID=UPI003F74BDA7
MFNKVYIIDDDEISVFLTETMLDVEHFAKEYRGFIAAQEALDFLIHSIENKELHNLPDIIFLDLNMPFMSGWELLDALSTYETQLAGKCRIFILTSSVDAQELKRAENYKLVAGFLQKPLEDDSLDKIRGLL